MAEVVHSFLNADVHSRLNKLMIIQRNNDIIAMLLDGKSTKDIKTYLVNKYRIPATRTNVYIADARRIIKERQNYEIDNLINLHIDRYELIYTGFNALQAWSNAMQALKAKEKLMGFHRAGFHMKVTQGEISQLQIHHLDDEYNVDKLTPRQRDRMQALIDKAKNLPANRKLRHVETNGTAN